MTVAGRHANGPAAMERRSAAAGLLACLLALAMHVLVPAGWMPAAAGLAPCSGLAAAGAGSPGPDGAPARVRCDFAVAAAPLLAAGGGDTVWPRPLPAVPAAAVLPALQVAHAWPRPLGQGPPLA